MHLSEFASMLPERVHRRFPWPLRPQDALQAQPNDIFAYPFILFINKLVKLQGGCSPWQKSEIVETFFKLTYEMMTFRITQIVEHEVRPLEPTFSGHAIIKSQDYPRLFDVQRHHSFWAGCVAASNPDDIISPLMQLTSHYVVQAAFSQHFSYQELTYQQSTAGLKLHLPWWKKRVPQAAHHG